MLKIKKSQYDPNPMPKAMDDNYDPEAQVKALIKAAWSVLGIQSSVDMRSNAVGETGVGERFTALRQALEAIDPHDPYDDGFAETPGYEGIGPSGTHGVDGYDDDFPYGR